MAQSAEKMQTVLLSGSLARLFGRRHRMITRGGWRDIMGYFKQFPGFERHMAESSSKGLRYAIFNGKENLSEDDLAKPTGRDVIRVVPVIAGSKRAGGLQTIIGVVLIAAATIMTGGFAGVAAGGAWGAVGAVGISMAVGGAISLLSAQTKGLSTQDGPNNRPSYSFNGAVNTSVQGNPVPLLYGRMIVGSAVISAGIYSEDQM
ncbi:tail assembly protein [Pseudomonas protegens]|uniref:tail assembly protein n=1 Tax=Pseudomonas protegens TaxID=380021 RepID=UPI002759D49F|nr:tail assembly protein [Pseudomonas protegens]MDP9528481.1 tail assembly protein [Pseudomonas protegens]